MERKANRYFKPMTLAYGLRMSMLSMRAAWTGRRHSFAPDRSSQEIIASEIKAVLKIDGVMEGEANPIMTLFGTV